MTARADSTNQPEGGRLPVLARLTQYKSARGNVYLEGRAPNGRLFLILWRHRADADGTVAHLCIAPPGIRLPDES